MSLTATVVGLTLALVVFALATYQSRRPYEPGRSGLVPYGALQFVALLAVILMLAHLVTLLTGKPFAGRMG